MKASGRDIALSFEEVNENVLSYFNETSENILKKYEPKEALNRALALVSGFKSIILRRSLLSGLENYITFIMEFDERIPNLNYI